MRAAGGVCGKRARAPRQSLSPLDPIKSFPDVLLSGRRTNKKKGGRWDACVCVCVRLEKG